MRLALITLFLTITTLSAEYVRQPIDQKLLDSKIKIIDIRTPSEWKTTGLIKGSIPITFFDEQGNYNAELFLGKLNKVVKKNEKFALICNSGNRTQVVGNFLGKELDYRVIDLQGGIQYAIAKKLPLESYKPKP